MGEVAMSPNSCLLATNAALTAYPIKLMCTKIVYHISASMLMRFRFVFKFAENILRQQTNNRLQFAVYADPEEADGIK